MGIQYEIKTLEDMHAIPDESLGAFLFDLAHWLCMCREVKDTDDLTVMRDQFIWIDDGKEGISGAHVVFKEDRA